MEHAEGEDEAGGPHGHEPEERHRTVDGENPLAASFRLERARHARPRLPGRAKIDARQAQAPRDGPRQDDGLERVPQDGRNQRQAEDESEGAQRGLVAISVISRQLSVISYQLSVKTLN